MTGDHLLARLLSFERNVYPPSAAFPSFHALWSIFIGRLARPLWLGWLYASVIAISCITTGMHYIPDVIVSFAIAPLFMEPGRWLWRPLLRLAHRFGLDEKGLAWLLVYALLGLILFCLRWRSSPAAIIVLAALIGVMLIEFARAGRRRGNQWFANRR